MKSITLRGGSAYREVQDALGRTWPIRAYLFVDEHIYWKEGRGELAPDDAVGAVGTDLVVSGDQSVREVGDKLFASFHLNLELRHADTETWIDGNPTLDEL